MIAVIITADREILEGVSRLIRKQVDGWAFVNKSDHPTLLAAINIADQIEKQLAPEVCPLLLSLKSEDVL